MLKMWWLQCVVVVGFASAQNPGPEGSRNSEFIGGEDKARGLFSPRMEYDEWTPLGHGNPLRNDPTYDYAPPKMERVIYWEELARKSNPNFSTPPPEVLLLGVSSQKKTTPKQEARKSPSDSRLFEAPKFQNRVRNPYIPLQNYYIRPQRVPNTMLVPPPPGKPQIYPTTEKVHPPTWDVGKTQLATLAASSSTELVTMATTTPPTTMKLHKVISPVIEITNKSAASSFLQLLLQNEMATAPSTTTTASMTTDPLFSHYKQPVGPLQGPMYLIIQGHSKVKKYGASKLDKISGIPVQDSNEVGDRKRRKERQIDYEDFIPVDEAVEAVVKDYVETAGVDGSGIGQILASLDS